MAELTTFEWDEDKNTINQRKHGIAFEEAQYAFSDSHRIIAKDLEHSDIEYRSTVLAKSIIMWRL